MSSAILKDPAWKAAPGFPLHPMAHFLCHYYNTNHLLSVNFVDASALIYGKIRGRNLGLCRQSEAACFCQADRLSDIDFFAVFCQYGNPFCISESPLPCSGLLLLLCTGFGAQVLFDPALGIRIHHSHLCNLVFSEHRHRSYFPIRVNCCQRDFIFILFAQDRQFLPFPSL